MHASILVSLGIVCWMGYRQPDRATASRGFALLMAGCGVLVVMATVFTPRLLAALARRSTPVGQRPAPRPKAADFVTAVLRWALAEAVAIYGLVLDMQGAPAAWTVPFYAVAVLLLIVYAPWYRREEIRSGPADRGGPAGE